MGIGVKLQEGACQLRLQGHGGLGHRMPKPGKEGEHGGLLGVHCLFKPVGEPACPHCEMEVRPSVGGRILPDRGPQAAGVGGPMRGVQGSRFLVLLRESSPAMSNGYRARIYPRNTGIWSSPSFSVHCIVSLQCSTSQISSKCCLEVTAHGGYRMFHGPSKSAHPPPIGAPGEGGVRYPWRRSAPALGGFPGGQGGVGVTRVRWQCQW